MAEVGAFQPHGASDLKSHPMCDWYVRLAMLRPKVGFPLVRGEMTNCLASLSPAGLAMISVVLMLSSLAAAVIHLAFRIQEEEAGMADSDFHTPG